MRDGFFFSRERGSYHRKKKKRGHTCFHEASPINIQGCVDGAFLGSDTVFEVGGEYTLSKGCTGNLNYFYNEIRDLIKLELHDVAEHRGNVGLNAAVTRFLNANTNLYVLGARRREKSDSRKSLPPVLLADVTLIVKNFYKGNDVRATIHNLFDQEYADPVAEANNLPGDMPRAGIIFLIEWRYSF